LEVTHQTGLAKLFRIQETKIGLKLRANQRAMNLPREKLIRQIEKDYSPLRKL